MYKPNGKLVREQQKHGGLVSSQRFHVVHSGCWFYWLDELTRHRLVVSSLGCSKWSNNTSTRTVNVSYGDIVGFTPEILTDFLKILEQ